jgi:peptide/nickel transport system substrate-binding protein
LLLLAAAPILLAASAGARAQEIVVALGAEPSTLDPQLQQDGAERAVTDGIYETLLARDKDGNLVPGLASQMPTQIDTTTWEVKLRPNIKFQDGEPFNADAVVFSLRRIVDPAYGSRQMAYVASIVGADKVDDLTVRIHTKGSDSVLLSRLYWVKIVPPQHAAEANFSQTPVGTGPYKFVTWDKGARIVIVANPDYWGAKPQIQKATFRFVSDSGARLAGLLAGEFDLTSNLSPDDVKRVPKYVDIKGIEHPFLIVNALTGVTADKRVRQALNYAVDKEAIAKQLYQGFARVDDGQTLSPSWFGYDPTLKAYPYDPAKARALLKEAGAEGSTIELITPAGRWLNDREVCEAVAGYWQAVGIKVNLNIMDWPKYLERIYDRTNRPQMIFVVNANQLLHADRTLSDYYAKSGRGSSNDDDVLNDLITRARAEPDMGKQKDLYHQALARTRDEAYFIFLVGSDILYGESKRLDWSPGVDDRMLVKDMKVAN